jgi:glyoxylase-like metal-dependent hydrolase (beta-lactamase superfamily II)
VPNQETSRGVTRGATFMVSAAVAIGALWLLTPHLMAQARPQPPKSLRVYVFDLGTLKIADPANFGFKKEQLATTDLAVAGYLVVHPKGTLMWDTGVVRDDEVGTQGRGADRAGKRTLKAQLAELGYTHKDVTYIGLSHYHGDHAANTNDFMMSTWLVQEPERDAMFAEPPIRMATRSMYDRLKESKTVILHNIDEYDVFGDGTVIVKAAYGHTPGHQVLVLKLNKTGPVALVGDLYHYPEERKLRTVVPSFEYNKEQSIASRNMIEDYVKKIGAQMWIEHDYAHHATLKKSPTYYE